MMSKKIKTILEIITYCALAVFLLSQNANAQGQTTVTTEVIGGEVGAISNNFISVIYSRENDGTENELALPISNDVKIKHRKSVHEIKTGDTVEVQFEVTKEDGKVISRKAKVITFLSPAKEEVVEFLEQEDRGGGNIFWRKRQKSNVSW